MCSKVLKQCIATIYFVLIAVTHIEKVFFLFKLILWRFSTGRNYGHTFLNGFAAHILLKIRI